MEVDEDDEEEIYETGKQEIVKIIKEKRQKVEIIEDTKQPTFDSEESVNQGKTRKEVLFESRKNTPTYNELILPSTTVNSFVPNSPLGQNVLQPPSTAQHSAFRQSYQNMHPVVKRPSENQHIEYLSNLLYQNV